MIDAVVGFFLNMSVDACTILVGAATAAFSAFMRYARGHKPTLSTGRCTVDLLNGVTLVPFGIMVGAAFSKRLLTDLLQSNMVIVAVAGVIGLIFVLGEILKPQHSLPHKPAE